ncbi:Tryptophan synthase beta subunit-like PLP-dependent enzyme, partial [Rhizoctonia solani]
MNQIERYLFLGYVNARSNKPHVGRRQLKLEVVEQFWTLNKAQKHEQISSAMKMEVPASFELGPDPYDILNLKDSRIIGTRGIVVRTHLDSKDEPTWNAFLTTLEDLERKSFGDLPDAQMESDSDSDEEEEEEGQGEGEETSQRNEDEEMADAGSKPICYESDALFTIVDPVNKEVYHTLRNKLSNASNITLLRLFNDASIAPSPSLSDNAPKRIKPGHRLIDEDGFQEVYNGGRIWVWDYQSTKDQTLRLISPQVFVYGDATGDSWRVKATHMWELQLNIDNGMRIDFSGGVGVGWDMNERARTDQDFISARVRQSWEIACVHYTDLDQQQPMDTTMTNIDSADMPLYIETPLVYSPVMSSRLGYEVYLKMENLQPSQSFKYRGISLFVSRAIQEHGSEVHIVAATSGSAGIALAWAGKRLNVRTLVFIPVSAVGVQAELDMAGSEVIVGGVDYADASLAAQAFCENKPKTRVLMSSYDHPTLWEGHSTMIHEIARQIPNKAAPNAIVCNVGGGGLLGGVFQGINELEWDRTKLIAVETHGANCYHLSLLANSPNPASRLLIPDNVAPLKSQSLTGRTSQAEVTLARLPAITSEASSLGARSPSQTTLEIGLACPELIAVSVPDTIAMQAVLGFLDEQKLLIEFACGATLSPAYTPGLLQKLLPKTLEQPRPVVVFIICGGSKATFHDTEGYRNMLLGNAETHDARNLIMIGSAVGLSTVTMQYHHAVSPRPANAMDEFSTGPARILIDPNNPMHIETPLIFSALMSSRLGYDIYLKLESLQPSQSFKYRGISLFATQAVKQHGSNTLLVMASGGNAGLALAWAGKALGVNTKIYIPAAAYQVQPTLIAAGADVVIGGADYSEALASAELLCSRNDLAILVPAYDHPVLWEGHSTLIHEIDRQLPNGTTPDAILCSVGGAGLLGGVLLGANSIGWDRTQVIALETIGANCYHMSLLANRDDPIGQSYIPDDVVVSTHPVLTPDVKRAKVAVAKLPAITSKAASLGASSPSQSVLEMGLARKDRATLDPTKFGGLTSVSIPDELAMRSTLGFLDEHKMLTELACATTLAPAYIPGLLEKLVPKSGGGKRPVVVFVVCGGSKVLLSDVEKYHSILQGLGEEGFHSARQQVLIETTLGLDLQ